MIRHQARWAELRESAESWRCQTGSRDIVYRSDIVTSTDDVCYRHYWRHRWRHCDARQYVTSLRLVPPFDELQGHVKDRVMRDGGRCGGGMSAPRTRRPSSAPVCSQMARAGTCWWRHWAMTSAPCLPPLMNVDTCITETEQLCWPPINQIVS